VARERQTMLAAKRDEHLGGPSAPQGGAQKVGQHGGRGAKNRGGEKASFENRRTMHYTSGRHQRSCQNASPCDDFIPIWRTTDWAGRRRGKIAPSEVRSMFLPIPDFLNTQGLMILRNTARVGIGDAQFACARKRAAVAFDVTLKGLETAGVKSVALALTHR